MTNCKLVRSLCLDIGLVNFWRVYELRLHLIPNTCILTLPEKLYFLISSSFRNPRGSKNNQSYDTHFADIDSSSGFTRIVCYLPESIHPPRVVTLYICGRRISWVQSLGWVF